MKKLTLLYGKLRKDKSASVDSFGCEKSYHKKWDSEKQLQERRFDDAVTSKESPVFNRKNQCMSDQLPRANFPANSTPYVEGPSGVFVGAEERIPTLRNSPWKKKRFFSDSEDESDSTPKTNRRFLRASTSDATPPPKRPQHVAVERLKMGHSRPPLQRTMSSPD